MDVIRILRIVAVLFAAIAGLVAVPQEAVIIAVLGLVGGVLVREEQRVPYMIMTLTLTLAHGALGPVPLIGIYLTDVLGSVSALLNAGACSVIVMAIVDRLRPHKGVASTVGA